jgi:hypothetical protein
MHQGLLPALEDEFHALDERLGQTGQTFARLLEVSLEFGRHQRAPALGGNRCRRRFSQAVAVNSSPEPSVT